MKTKNKLKGSDELELLDLGLTGRRVCAGRRRRCSAGGAARNVGGARGCLAHGFRDAHVGVRGLPLRAAVCIPCGQSAEARGGRTRSKKSN